MAKCWKQTCDKEALSAGYVNGTIRRLCDEHAEEVVLQSAHMELNE